MEMKLTIAYLSKYGDNWITEDVEIGFPPPGDAS
jgi:hypothetical protein